MRRYLTAKSLIRPRSEDCLTVATVDTERAQRLSAYKPGVIKNRYESDLVTFLPTSRWRVHVVKTGGAGAKTRDVVTAFVNNRPRMPTAVRTHPDPTLVCVGFAGRSTRASRDPTVAGQVACLTMRDCFCPLIVCKRVPAPVCRHFVMLVEATPRCVAGARVLRGLLRDDDKLTFLHALSGLPGGAFAAR